MPPHVFTSGGLNFEHALSHTFTDHCLLYLLMQSQNIPLLSDFAP